MFVVEGIKVVNEFLNSSYELESLFSTDTAFSNIDGFVDISEEELKKISRLTTPNKVVGLFRIPEEKQLESKGLIVALDAINDPGNLGTIIRLCDWFGVNELICSKDTVDCYNSKVVQASMGSLTRISITYCDLEEYINTSNLPSFIADMDGANVYQTKLPKEAILIMGNEANGISEAVRNLVENKVSIPRFGNLQQTESLNVATATAILLSEFRR